MNDRKIRVGLDLCRNYSLLVVHVLLEYWKLRIVRLEQALLAARPSFNEDLCFAGEREKWKRMAQYRKSRHFQFIHRSFVRYPSRFATYSIAILQTPLRALPRSSRIHCSIYHQFQANGSRFIPS